MLSTSPRVEVCNNQCVALGCRLFQHAARVYTEHSGGLKKESQKACFMCRRLRALRAFPFLYMHIHICGMWTLRDQP
jgi:predicted transcriptional regulator